MFCALALAGCGDADESTSVEAPSVQETIVTAAQSDDPADCLRLSTLAFLEQSSKVEDEAAVAVCEEVAVDPGVEDPKEVIVSDVEIDGSAATATVRFVGGGYDGQTVRFGLVQRDGIWKLDELLGFIELDAESLIVEFGREGLRRATSPADVQLFACMIDLLQQMDTEEVEAFFVDSGPDQLQDMVRSCVSGSQTV